MLQDDRSDLAEQGIQLRQQSSATSIVPQVISCSCTVVVDADAGIHGVREGIEKQEKEHEKDQGAQSSKDFDDEGEAGAEDGCCDGEGPGKRRRGNPKEVTPDYADPKLKLSNIKEVFRKEIRLEKGSRPVSFLDDLLAAIDAAHGSVAHHVDTDAKLKMKSTLVSLGIEFLWSGSVQIGKEILRDWSTVRKALQQKLLTSFMGPGSSPEVIDSEQIVRSLLLSLGDQPVLEATDVDGSETFVSLLEGCQTAFKEFLDKNLASKAVVLHPAYRGQVLEKMCLQSVDKMPIIPFFSTAYDVVMGVFDQDWLVLGKEAALSLARIGRFPTSMEKLFSDAESLDTFMGLRAACVAQLVMDTSSIRRQGRDDDPLSTVSAHLAGFRGSFSELAVLGMALMSGQDDKEKWVKGWVHCCTSLNLMKVPTYDGFRQSIGDTIRTLGLAEAPRPATVKVESTTGESTRVLQRKVSFPDAYQLSLSEMYGFMGNTEIGSNVDTVIDDEPVEAPTHKVAAGDVDMPLLKLLCNFVEQKLMELEFLHSADLNDKIALDIVQKPPLLVFTGNREEAKHVKLYFAGEVSLSSGPNSHLLVAVELMNAEGVAHNVLPMFVHGTKYLSALGCECIIPAWLVPKEEPPVPVKPKAKASAAKARVAPATVMLKYEVFKWSLPEHLGKPSANTISVRVPFLAPTEEMGATTFKFIRHAKKAPRKRKGVSDVFTTTVDVASVIGCAALLKSRAAAATAGSPAAGSASADAQRPKKVRSDFEHVLR